MIDRRAIKRSAREQLKRHYLLLTVLCAVSIFLGTEFTGVATYAQVWYNALTGQNSRLNTDGMLELQRVREVRREAIGELIGDDIHLEKVESAARMQAMRDESDPNAMFGRQKGVLAMAVNSLDSGHLYATLGSALMTVLHSRKLAALMMILGSLAIYALVWIFLRNIYRVILRRAVLELRLYRRIPLSHYLHFKLVRRWTRASLTLLLAAVYEMLWRLTLVGGVIKHYSYLLVPFIVAENPDIRPREAVTLSRRMMNGHKWECFKLELSFLGWMILGFFTFGAVDALWAVPYRVAAYGELYAKLREAAKASGLEGAALLNDDCLFARADEAALHRRYADIARREDLIDGDIVDLPPVQRFFARNFGIWLGSLVEKKIYSRQAGLRQQTRVGRMELNGEAYPQRMNALWTRKNAALTGKVSYLTPCTVWTLIVVFFVFSIAGWVWEVSLHLITHGQFVNRGALHGPWLPIYGSGVVMIAVLLYRLRTRPALEALAVMVLCGAVEYLTSYFMELSKGMRWWDYTGYYLNLNGRICGEGLAVFAVGGMAAVYLAVPIIDAMVTRVRPRVLVPVCLALALTFTGDIGYSHFVPNAGTGITDDPEVAPRAAGAQHVICDNLFDERQKRCREAI